MNILAECLKHASIDPERARASASKLAAITAMAHNLYAMLKPLSGQIAIHNGKEVRINVARMTENVKINLYERVAVPPKGRYGDGRPVERPDVMMDTRNLVASAEVAHDGAKFVFTDFSGLQKGAADMDALGLSVAASVGPLLKVEV